MSRPLVRPLARLAYDDALARMRAFTAGRDAGTPDEIWLVEHPPVFTLGLATRPEHLLATGDIPVVQTERGGQVTYHGPGQALAYTLVDLRRHGLMVRDFVRLIEQAVIEVLADLGLTAVRREGAPGVYLSAPDGGAGAKIASIGIKVSRGCTYHGVALNVAMDLEPFSRIDPCGYPGLAVTDLRSLLGPATPAMETVATLLGEKLADLIEGKA
ncbi:MAG: octanoyltransferase [Lautropia sp. SCN 70-15]|nr:MAG: octanoyltransferase [Lautropia sp. SCN 70-15]